MSDKNRVSKGELGAKDLGKFWLYMAIIALCIAALLYMLISAKPRVSPAVKTSSGGSSSLVLPLMPMHARRVAC